MELKSLGLGKARIFTASFHNLRRCFGRLSPFYFIVLPLALNCSPQTLDVRKGNNGRVGGGTTTGNGTQAGTGIPAGTNTTTTGTVIADPDNLAAYLFKHVDAVALKPLVLPYELPTIPQNSIPQTSSSYTSIVTATGAFFTTAFQKPVLAPGRSLQIFAVENDSLNASADGFQRVTLNTGLLKVKNNPLFISTICHESAHSARNHVVRSLPVADRVLGTDSNPNPAFKLVTDRIDAYMSKQYNGNTYTHKKTEFLSIKQAFDAATLELSTFTKRAESEADIVGSYICAQAGMKSEEFIQGYVDFTALVKQMQASQSSSYSKPEDIPDNTRFSLTRPEAESLVSDFLFHIDSHPLDEERNDQLRRLKDLTDLEFDATVQMYADFVRQLSQANGISLVERAPLSAAEIDKLLNVRKYGAQNGAGSIVIYDPKGEAPSPLWRRLRLK